MAPRAVAIVCTAWWAVACVPQRTSTVTLRDGGQVSAMWRERWFGTCASARGDDDRVVACHDDPLPPARSAPLWKTLLVEALIFGGVALGFEAATSWPSSWGKLTFK